MKKYGVHALCLAVFSLLLITANENALAQIKKTNEVAPVKRDLRAYQRFNEAQLLQTPRVVIEGSIDPDTYLLGPGDELLLTLYGQSQEESFPVSVLPEGVINIPSYGEIDIKGNTLSDTRKTVLSSLKEFYPQSRISLNLTYLRVFKVYVTGAAMDPGLYYANFTTRVSDIIQQANGLGPAADGKLVEVRHLDGTVTSFDYWAYFGDGNQEINVSLKDGDVIFIPRNTPDKEYVLIQSPVEIMGYYNYYENETLEELISRTKLDSLYIDWRRITVTRDSTSEAKEYVEFNKDESISSITDFELQPNDVLNIPYMYRYVFVEGEVKNPGFVLWEANRRASHFVGMAGKTARAVDDNNVRVYHIASGELTKGGDPFVIPGDRIYVPQKRTIRWKEYFDFVVPLTSLIISAKAVGWIK